MVEGPQALLKSQKLQILVRKRILQLFLYSNSGTSSSITSTSSSTSTDSATELVGRNTQSEMVGSTLLQVDCIGKELFFVFGHPPDRKAQKVLRLHFGMNGSERICKCDKTSIETFSSKIVEDMAGKLMPPRSRKKLTAGVVLEGDESEVHLLLLWDSNVSLKSAAYLGAVQSRRNRDIMQHDFFDIALVHHMLSNDGREIYEAIMDQEVLPGVGNIIKCEALFNASVNPYSIAKLIPTDTLTILIEKLKQFAYDWYVCKQRHRDIVKNVYGLDSCSRCRKDVRLVRSGILQRITYYCETCQQLYAASTTASGSSSSGSGSRFSGSSSSGGSSSTSSGTSSRSGTINSSSTCINRYSDHEKRNFNNGEYPTTAYTSNIRITSSSSSNTEVFSEYPNLSSAGVTKWKCRFCEYLNIVSDLDDHHNDENYLCCTICGESWRNENKKRNFSDGFINEPGSADVSKKPCREELGPSTGHHAGTEDGKRKREQQHEVEEDKDMLQASVGGRLPFLIAPLCKCRAQSVLVRVRKSGPTLHRLFWACRRSSSGGGGSGRNSDGTGHGKKTFCDFFHWADGLFPKCPRHNVVCILRRVLKDGPNNGRYFFSCSSVVKGNNTPDARNVATTTACNTFIWAEVSGSGAAATIPISIHTPGTSSRSTEAGPKILKASKSIVIPL